MKKQVTVVALDQFKDWELPKEDITLIKGGDGDDDGDGIVVEDIIVF